MENKKNEENKKNSLSINELYQQFTEQKIKISEEALRVLGGHGTKKVVGEIWIALLVILIGLAATLISIYALTSWQIIDPFGFWILIALSVLLYLVVIISLRMGLTFYKDRRKEKKAFKADAQQIADTQQTAFEIHDRLKELFIPGLKQQLVWMGFGTLEGVLFPLGNQTIYNAKALEAPSLEINNFIEQISKNHALKFSSASLKYYGEDSSLPPYQSIPGYYLSISLTERTAMEIKSMVKYYPIEFSAENE